MTSIDDMAIDTNVITLKITHSNPFRKETTKTRIFILQVDNKITNIISCDPEYPCHGSSVVEDLTLRGTRV